MVWRSENEQKRKNPTHDEIRLLSTSSAAGEAEILIARMRERDPAGLAKLLEQATVARKGLRAPRPAESVASE